MLSSFAWIIVAYAYYAKNRGWWISNMFISDTSMVKLIAYIALPCSAFASAYLGIWWEAIIVIILGLIVALLLTNLLRSFVQYIAVIGIITCWVLGIYMVFHT